MLKDEMDNAGLQALFGDAAPWILARSLGEGTEAGGRGKEGGEDGRGGVVKELRKALTKSKATGDETKGHHRSVSRQSEKHAEKEPERRRESMAGGGVGGGGGSVPGGRRSAWEEDQPQARRFNIRILASLSCGLSPTHANYAAFLDKMA